MDVAAVASDAEDMVWAAAALGEGEPCLATWPPGDDARALAGAVAGRCPIVSRGRVPSARK